MDGKPLITVIVPVYNVEKYLDKCVESVIGQTYRALEIILVDDGSIDRSGIMCDYWKKKDGRIHVVHKENGGLSSARNAALDICHGDYVLFVDSDDYLDQCAVEIMLDDALKADADIVEVSFCNIYGDRQYVKSKGLEMKIMNTLEAIKYDLGAQGGAVSSCAKLFRKDIFLTYRFAEGRLHEDHYSIVDILSKAGTIAIEPRPLYYYMHRRESITTSCFTQKSLEDLEAANKNYSIIKARYPQALDVAEFRIDISTLKIIDKIMLSENWKDNPYLNELVDHVRGNRDRILKSRYATRNRKLSVLLLLTNRSLYQRVVKEKARRSCSG
ncbi:MAG: glycosyltransferase [Hungatella sp.]|nr:glycosyltransferase [Hungatella sp.]